MYVFDWGVGEWGGGIHPFVVTDGNQLELGSFFSEAAPLTSSVLFFFLWSPSFVTFKVSGLFFLFLFL